MVTVGGFGFGCMTEGGADPPDPCQPRAGLVLLTKSAAHGHVSVLLLSGLSGSPSLAPQIPQVPTLPVSLVHGQSIHLR